MDLHALVTSPRFFVSAAILAFFALAARALWRVGTGVLDRRAVSIRAELDEAAALRAEAERLLVDASSRRDAALKEAAALLEAAHREAERLGEAARSAAAASAQRREKMATDRIAAAEKAAINDLRSHAALAAVGAAQNILGEGLPESTARGLVQAAIDGLPGALQGR